MQTSILLFLLKNHNTKVSQPSERLERHRLKILSYAL